MRRFELTAEDLVERLQTLTAELVSADKGLDPKGAMRRSAETIHVQFDEDGMREALRDAAFRLGGRDKNFLSGLLRTPDPLILEEK
jgi:hypothetical protein